MTIGYDRPLYVLPFDHRGTFCKVLVRYNPEGDSDAEPAPGGAAEATVGLPAFRRPAASSCSSCWCPRRQGQLSRSGGDKKEYDRGLRPGLMVQAITELQATGIEPDVWKIEGIDQPEDCSDGRRLGAAGRARPRRLHRPRPRRG